MMNEQKLDNLLERLGQVMQSKPGLSERVMACIDADAARPSLRRFHMSKTYKRAGLGLIAAAAAACLVVATWIVSRPQPAYALSQTIAAFEGVRYVSAVVYGPDDTQIGTVQVQLDADGVQGKIRQEGAVGDTDLLIVDDGETAWAYFRNKNTVILSPTGKYQWIRDFGEFFRELQSQPDSVVIEMNVEYKGRLAHLVRHLRTNQDIYIDPKTSLPLAIGGMKLDYSPIDPAVFDLPETPQGVAVVDQRPGAVTATAPAWVDQDEEASRRFDLGRKALAAGDVQQAIELLEFTVSVQPGRNWAHVYLGQAYVAAGRHEEAAESYARVIDMSDTIQMPAPYANLARGRAYRLLGQEEAARADFAVALAHMILALRNPMGGVSFDYADDPMYREARRDGRAPEGDQSVWLMIQRLRDVTGENFGYDPAAPGEQRAQAIAAWEQWWREHAATYGPAAK